MSKEQDSSQWHPITSGDQLSSWTKESQLCVVYFTAPWCFRCKQVEPKVKSFPLDFPHVQFLRVNVDEVVDLADELNISTLPTFTLYRNGTEVHRLEGVPQKRPARALAQALNTYLEG